MHKQPKKAASARADAGAPAKSKKKKYQRPRLTVYGDVRDLTLGGSIGHGESGNFNRFP